MGSKRGCLRGLDSEDDMEGARPDMKVGSQLVVVGNGKGTLRWPESGRPFNRYLLNIYSVQATESGNQDELDS